MSGKRYRSVEDLVNLKHDVLKSLSSGVPQVSLYKRLPLIKAVNDLAEQFGGITVYEGRLEVSWAAYRAVLHELTLHQGRDVNQLVGGAVERIIPEIGRRARKEHKAMTKCLQRALSYASADVLIDFYDYFFELHRKAMGKLVEPYAASSALINKAMALSVCTKMAGHVPGLEILLVQALGKVVAELKEELKDKFHDHHTVTAAFSDAVCQVTDWLGQPFSPDDLLDDQGIGLIYKKLSGVTDDINNIPGSEDTPGNQG